MNFKQFFQKKDKSLMIHLGILISVFLIIFFVNFPFGTWYTGWDNLHPEFNFGMNFWRALNAVWQMNQGTGTYGGHGYAATLFHTLFLWVLSIIIPLQYLRSFFTFFTLFVGGIGVFFLLRKILLELTTSTRHTSSHSSLYKEENNQYYTPLQKNEIVPIEKSRIHDSTIGTSSHNPRNDNLIDTASLLAALYYMLNLATVQNFYIQLEAFIVHFAALPWLFFTLFVYLKNKTRKNLLIFALVNLVASVQGFIPPLFFVYMMLLGIFLFFYVLIPSRHSGDPDVTSGESRIKSDDTLKGFRSWMRFAYQDDAGYIEKLKTAVILILITLAMNAYWFLPVVNYSLTRSGTYLNAYNNLSSTDDFIWKNKKFGNIQNVALLRGFIFEAIDADNSGNVFLIFQNWQKHLDNPLVSITGYAIFGVIILGAVTVVRKKRNWYVLGVAGGLLLVFSLMATDSFPFSIVTQIMQHIPVIKQAFRVAFTKFSIALSFYYALCFGLGVWFLIDFFRKKTWSRPLITTLSVILLFFFSLPIFQGNFLYQRTKIQIPSMYFQLFDFFKHQDKHTRIANFPQGWNWGWSIYKWGYSGSGFLWYGIEQPIMDRAYDVWGKYNEQYYWELAHAIFAERYDLIDEIVEKYQVNWLVFDDNIIPYASVKSFLYGERLKEHFQSSSKYTLVKTLNPENASESPIWIYKVNLSKDTSNFSTVYQPSEIKEGIFPYQWTNEDKAFLDFGRYYSMGSKDFITYPFQELFTNRKPGELPFKVEETDQYIIYHAQLPSSLKKFSLTIPPLLNDEMYSTTYPQSLQLGAVPQIYAGGQLIYPTNANQITTQAEMTMNEIQAEDVEVRLPKAGFPLAYENTTDPDFFSHKAVNCNTLLEQINKTPGTFEQTILDQNVLHFRSIDTENCYDIWTGLSQRFGYMVRFDSKFIQGQPLRFAVIDHQSRKPSAINLLPEADFTTNTYIIPPMKWDGVGYNLHFNTISIGNVVSENELKNITIRPIPYTFLSNLRITSTYTPTILPPVLGYYQSYDSGWRAYQIPAENSLAKIFPFLFGKELKNHIMVNNWANGWTLPLGEQNNGDASYTFIFLPQSIEYIGFILAIITFGFLIYRGKRK